MKLLTLAISNFRGIPSLTINANGRNINIYGLNGAGKTTTEDAFLWLLFGKDSADKKDFDLIPHKLGIVPPESDIGQGKEPTVEGALEYFGKTVKLKKSYIEEWPKKGEFKGQYAGSKTHYYVDDLEVKAGEYQNVISELVDDKLFKLLTNPRYFSETLTWQERRETLVKIGGELNIVINPELATLMEGRPFDKFHQLSKQNVKEKQKQLDGIPYAISALQRIIPDNIPDAPDIKNLQEIKSELDNKLQMLKNDDSKNAKRREIAIVETEIAEARAKYITGIDADNAKIKAGIEKLETENMDKKREASNLNYGIKNTTDEAESLGAKKTRKLAEYREVYNKQWTGSDTCPTCGQAMPVEQIDAAKAVFNLQRSEDLERLKTEGTELKTAIDQQQNKVLELQADCKALEDKISVLVARIEKGRSMLKEAHFEDVTLAVKLDKLKSELNGDSNNLAQILDLEFKISAVQDQINNAERVKIQIEQKAEQVKNVVELMAQEKTLNAELGRYEKAVNLCAQHVKTMAKALETAVNGKFKIVKFQLFEMQKNGEEAECCNVVYPNGSTNLSTGEKIQTGVDIINTLSEYYGVDAPIWIDNFEGITKDIESKAQLIFLNVSKSDLKLRVEVL